MRGKMSFFTGNLNPGLLFFTLVGLLDKMEITVSSHYHQQEAAKPGF